MKKLIFMLFAAILIFSSCNNTESITEDFNGSVCVMTQYNNYSVNLGNEMPMTTQTLLNERDNNGFLCNVVFRPTGIVEIIKFHRTLHKEKVFGDEVLMKINWKIISKDEILMGNKIYGFEIINDYLFIYDNSISKNYTCKNVLMTFDRGKFGKL